MLNDRLLPPWPTLWWARQRNRSFVPFDSEMVPPPDHDPAMAVNGCWPSDCGAAAGVSIFSGAAGFSGSRPFSCATLGDGDSASASTSVAASVIHRRVTFDFMVVNSQQNFIGRRVARPLSPLVE